MRIYDLKSATRWFEVFETTEQSQTAVMKLAPGQESGKKGNEHPDSDQVLLVLEGEVTAEIEDDRQRVRAGQCVTVPAGASHHFVNEGKVPAVTFNVYTPPAYDEYEKG